MSDTPKIINLFTSQGRSIITDEEKAEHKKIILEKLDHLKKEVENGDVYGLGIAINYYAGSTGNSYYIPFNPVTLIGELDCLRRRVAYNETDIN